MTAAATGSGTPRPDRWLLGPWADALLIANVAWPLLLIVQSGNGFGGGAGLRFWQLYYVTTPHRWITLFLVFFDAGRFRQRAALFTAVAAAAVIICLGVRLTTGALTCLLAIDYVWNAWHFAAQHHGVYRIYARQAGCAPSALERWAMRGFLLFVILRVATATWPDGGWPQGFRCADALAAGLPIAILVREVARSALSNPGGLLYLASVSGLYLALLWAVHAGKYDLVLPLATASALFHAIEYLTLVTWSVRQRHASAAGDMGMLGTLVPRWGLALGVFVLVLGLGGRLMDQQVAEGWLTVKVIVAFLHYTYDGLIWRRQPAAQPSGAV